MTLFQSVTQAAWNKNPSPPNRNQTYDFLAWVVQKNYHYPADYKYSGNQYYCTIQWIEIYPVENIIHLLNNGARLLAQMFYNWATEDSAHKN